MSHQPATEPHDAHCAAWRRHGRQQQIDRRHIYAAAVDYHRAAVRGEYNDGTAPDEYLRINTHIDVDGALRVRSLLSFRHQLRRSRTAYHELCALRRGAIGDPKRRRGCSKYASPRMHERRVMQITAQRDYLATSVLRNERGDTLQLAQCANTAERRAAKFGVRCRGQQLYAAERGWGALFITATLPPEYHPNPSHGKQQWDGKLTPIDGARALQRRWRKFQKWASKNALRIFGAKVVEAHKDACPHLHALLYIPPQRRAEVEAALHRALGAAPACEVRDVVKRSDDDAEPATYIMHYICKQVAADNPDAVTAHESWRSAWGLRTVQMFDRREAGGLWDELRRVRPDSALYRGLPGAAREIVDLARANDWGNYLVALDALNGRANSRVRVWRKTEASERAMSGKTTHVQGVVFDGLEYDTHAHTWDKLDADEARDWLAAAAGDAEQQRLPNEAANAALAVSCEAAGGAGATPATAEATLRHTYPREPLCAAAAARKNAPADAAQPPARPVMVKRISDSPPTTAAPPPRRPQHRPPSLPACRAATRYDPLPA